MYCQDYGRTNTLHLAIRSYLFVIHFPPTPPLTPSHTTKHSTQTHSISTHKTPLPFLRARPELMNHPHPNHTVTIKNSSKSRPVTVRSVRCSLPDHSEGEGRASGERGERGEGRGARGVGRAGLGVLCDSYVFISCHSAVPSTIHLSKDFNILAIVCRHLKRLLIVYRDIVCGVCVPMSGLLFALN